MVRRKYMFNSTFDEEIYDPETGIIFGVFWPKKPAPPKASALARLGRAVWHFLKWVPVSLSAGVRRLGGRPMLPAAGVQEAPTKGAEVDGPGMDCGPATR
jgi:hypothetical protein